MTRGLKLVVGVGAIGIAAARSTECPYDEGTETPRSERVRWRRRCSTECPYDEGTETPIPGSASAKTYIVPPSAPMTRGLKPETRDRPPRRAALFHRVPL